MSGAEYSLLEMLRGLPDGFEPTVACPEGALADAVGALGVPVVRIPGTEGSLKLHPWRTARALAELGAEAVSIRRISRRLGTQVVHANSIRAGIAACLGLRGGLPTVVQLRDSLPPGRVSSMTLGLIDRWATLVLSNSSYTQASFERVPRRAQRAVLYSPVDLRRLRPGVLSRGEARERLGIGPDDAVLVVLAQLTPWKAQDDAVRLLAQLRERFPAIRLVLVGSAKFVSGSTRYDNVTYVRELHELVASLGCEDRVLFLGERSDVPEILSAADVLVAPSWEEPFGRSVVEAMATEVPVIATDRGGPAESVRDGVDGFLVPPRRPGEWVGPATRLLENPELRARMGASGRERVSNLFATGVIAGELARHYREVTSVSA